MNYAILSSQSGGVYQTSGIYASFKAQPSLKMPFYTTYMGVPPAPIHYICVINGSFPPKFRVLDRTLDIL